MEFSKEAKQIVEAVGGEENIAAVTHCVTRLRFALNDESKVDSEALSDLKIVKGTFSANGQYQVVIGQGTVDKVYAAMNKESGISEATKDDVKNAAAKKTKSFATCYQNVSGYIHPNFTGNRYSWFINGNKQHSFE